MTHKAFIGAIITSAALLALAFSPERQSESACAQGVICPAPEVSTEPLSG